jgi:hypothetical protein
MLYGMGIGPILLKRMVPREWLHPCPCLVTKAMLRWTCSMSP